MAQDPIIQLIEAESLPKDFINSVDRYYRPLSQKIADRKQDSTLLLGVQGAQGSGKSTLALFLKTLLEEEQKLRVAVISIDDVYLTKRERQQLAADVHPLLITRGVPGTHDIALANQTIATLSQLKAGELCAIPSFNKASDDRNSEDMWPKASGSIDVIIFEGWCIGAEAQPLDELETALNDLELTEDADGHWRNYVNQRLASDYKNLFNKLDALVVVQAPSFECVYEWRSLQEQKLIKRVQQQGGDSSGLLNSKQLKRFISHYERLTRHCLVNLANKADWLLTLDSKHNITGMKIKEPSK